MTKTIPAAFAALSAIAMPTQAQDTIALDPIIVSGGLTPIEVSRYGRAARPASLSKSRLDGMRCRSFIGRASSPKKTSEATGIELQRDNQHPAAKPRGGHAGG